MVGASGADAVGKCGRPYLSSRSGETRWDPARSGTPCMHGRTSRGNREIPCLPASEFHRPRREVSGHTPAMHEHGKSDSSVVPGKPPNNAGSTRPRRWWREGGWPRGGRSSKHAPDTEPDQACQVSGAHTLTRRHRVSVLTRGGSRMREIRPSGSEEGAVGNHRPYSAERIRKTSSSL